MSYINKCRVCLVDGAKYPIFEGTESKESVNFKLFQCFNEKVEDIEGYPRKICDKCNDMLNTTFNFISKYRTSCKILESGLIVVKSEAFSDNDMEKEYSNDKIDLGICKTEPDSDGLESPDDFWGSVPEIIMKEDRKLTDLKKKLKNLKDINFRKKPIKNITRKNKIVASSILEAAFDWKGESLKSRKSKAIEEVPKGKRNDTKQVLPKLPPGPPPSKLCDICGEVFKDQDKLMAHKHRKHFRTPVKCPKCPRTLASQYYLKRHLKRTHDNEKSFICDTCGRGFAFRGELSTHTKYVHLKIRKTAKKNQVCNICDKKFFNAKSLIIHERSAHTGLRPAECKECGACFFHEDYLKEHMRLHTGETPFKCPICNRGYAQRGNMRSHMSHNHRLTDLSPEQIKSLKPSWFKFLKKP